MVVDHSKVAVSPAVHFTHPSVAELAVQTPWPPPVHTPPFPHAGAADVVADYSKVAVDTGVRTAANVAGAAYGTATHVAGAAIDTASNVAGSAINTATNVAGAAYDTAANVAGSAVDTGARVAGAAVVSGGVG